MILIDLNLVPASFKANNRVYAPIKDGYLYVGYIQPDIYFGIDEFSPGDFFFFSF